MAEAALHLRDPLIQEAETVLRTGLGLVAGSVQLACSFSVEDVVVLDLALQADLALGLFAIDTGRLPEETYLAAESLRERYGVEIDWYFPQAEAVQKLTRVQGLFSFRESLEQRRHCCAVRKVEPLQRALAGLAGWATGMRREQSQTREEIEPLQQDSEHGGILKLNPLYNWRADQVWDYANQRRLPLHPLHKQGYPSIGCAPCTRAVAEGDDPRSGRWWWEDAHHKECGLHR